MAEKTNTFIVFFLLLVLAVTVTVMVHCGREIRLMGLQFRNSGQPLKNVRCEWLATVGNKQLRMVFSIASEDLAQREALLRKLPRIKHDLQVYSNRTETVSWCEGRDFAAIKSHLLEIVNRHSPRSVKALYIETFYYE